MDSVQLSELESVSLSDEEEYELNFLRPKMSSLAQHQQSLLEQTNLVKEASVI